MGALKDCEAVVDGLLGQPINTLTTLAFVLGGVVIWARSGSKLIACALAATGVGSFLFHGPMPAYAQVAHDVTLWFLVAVVVVTVAVDVSRIRGWSDFLAPGMLLALVAIVGRLGATGGPLCDPGSPWQTHGLWHVGAAVAITWWAVRRET